MSVFGHSSNNAACKGLFGMLKRERKSHRRYRIQDETGADLLDGIERLHNPRVQHGVAG